MKTIKKKLFQAFMFINFYLTNTMFFWWFLKVFNILSKGKIFSFFIIYATNEKYLNYYTSQFIRKKFGWGLCLVGFNIQGGKLGINFGFNVLESAIKNPDNLELLKKRISEIEKLKKFVSAEYVNYSGILPSFLKKNNINSSQSSSPLFIANILKKSVDDIVSKESKFLGQDFCLVILGGKGYIGSKTVELLKDSKIPIISVDNSVADYLLLQDFLPNYKKNLFLNISTAGVIEQLCENHTINEDSIVINEVYPEPADHCVNYYHSLYQIKGVKSQVYPNLPYSYKNALPCCAIIPELNDINHIQILYDFYKK